MSTAKQQLVDDVQFVFDECDRFQNQMLSGLRFEPNSREAMEHFCTIPHPEVTWSFQVCGSAAYDRLRALAQRAARNSQIDRTVSIEKVRKELASVIVRKFQNEKLELNVRNVERALSEAARRSASKRKDVTHYLACHLMLSKNPSTFQIGPITFHSRSGFRSKIAASLNANRADLRRDRRVLNHAFSYYKTFGWVAEVTIPACDKDTSEELAVSAVRSALDCLHLLLGYQHTRRMVIEGPAIIADRRARLSETNGSIGFSVTYGGAPGEVGFPDDWFGQFQKEGWLTAVQLLGIALESAVHPRIDRPLSRRFLDAAQWFGEAVRETSRAAKVVKYITALERILMTDEKDDISETIALRAAAMCCELTDPSSFELWKLDTKKAYSLRSKLVHGSMSQSSTEVAEGIGLSARIAEAAIHSALAGFGEVGLMADGVSTRKLADWYNRRVDHVQELMKAISIPA